MLEKIKAFLRSPFAIIIAMTVIGFFIGRYMHIGTYEPPPVTEVESTDAKTLKEKMPDLTSSDARHISKGIERAKEKAPTYHYYTYTQEAADKKAQDYAKLQKADKIIKTTTEKAVVDAETGKPDKVIENDYYAISLEKKHRIEVGAANIDCTSYVTLGYRNRDVAYTAYYSPTKGSVSAGVSVTVAKW